MLELRAPYLEDAFISKGHEKVAVWVVSDPDELLVADLCVCVCVCECVCG